MGSYQLINEPTHLLEKSTSCIDLIFTAQPNLVVGCCLISCWNCKEIMTLSEEQSLPEKCSYSDFFWSVFSAFGPESSEYGHFSRCELETSIGKKLSIQCYQYFQKNNPKCYLQLHSAWNFNLRRQRSSIV